MVGTDSSLHQRCFRCFLPEAWASHTASHPVLWRASHTASHPVLSWNRFSVIKGRGKKALLMNALLRNSGVSSLPFPKFLLLSLKPKDFVSRNFLTLGFSHRTQFLGKVPHLVFQRGWHWPLDLFDFKMNRNQQKGKKKKLPHVHLTLTYSPSPGAASGLAVWITSGHLIHPQSLSLNSRTNICPVWSKVWERSSLLFSSF